MYKYLTQPHIDRKALGTLFKKFDPKQKKPISLKKIEDRLYAQLINSFDYDIKKAIKWIEKERALSYATVNSTAGRIMRKILADYDIEELKQERSQKRKAIKNFKGHIETVERAIKSHRQLLSYFNIKTKELEEALKSIDEKGHQDSSSYLKELYTLRALFLAKAKGDITTRTTEIAYEMKEENGQLVKKAIKKNSEGKKIMWEKTQSHLPDEKALMGLKIVDDMILQVETREQVEVTEDELKELYLQAQKKAEQDRQIYIAEIIE